MTLCKKKFAPSITFVIFVSMDRQNTASAKAKSPKVQHLNNLFDAATWARMRDFEYKKECEEFYYADVENTHTEYTKHDLERIRERYNIPLSTKIVFPIIENLIAQLTGTKPYPRLVAANDKTRQFAQLYEQAQQAVAYESNQSAELTKAIRDWMITGSGFMITKKADFYDDSTFNVINNHVYWRNVFIDPESRKSDLSDAQFVCIASMQPRKKAETLYDVKIPKDVGNDVYDLNSRYGVDEDRLRHYFNHNYVPKTKKDFAKYVLVREFYEQIVKKKYISLGDNAFVTGQEPVLTTISNPEYEALIMQQQQFEMIAQELAENGTPEQMQQLQQQGKQLTEELKNTPKTVERYEFKTKHGVEHAEDYRMIREIAIRRTLVVNDHIVEEETMYDLTQIPIVHLSSMFAVQSFKTYGMVHYVKDMAKAMNKLLGNTLLNYSIHGNRKLLVREDSILDKDVLEKDWSKPGAVISYRGQENDATAMPQPVDAPPIPDVVRYMIDQLRFMIEYTTGMNSLMQGMPNEAPNTLGGTQSILSFGTQRMKSYSRILEPALQKLSYNTITFLKLYAPKDSMVTYLDDNNNAIEVELPKGTENLQFKVRVEMQKSMPTHRAMASSLLGSVAGQTKDPHLANVLTEHMLKNLDLMDGDKIAEDIGAVKRMEQQMAQMQEQLKQSEGRVKSLENNLAQAKTKSNVDQATASAEKDIAVQKEQISNQLENQSQETDEIGDVDGF